MCSYKKLCDSILFLKKPCLQNYYVTVLISVEAAKCALETRKVKLCDIRTAADFMYKRDQERTVLQHPKDECCVCCEEDNQGLLMKCGHYFCPNDLLDCAWQQVKVQKYEISCIVCARMIDIEDIIKFGLPGDDERQLLTTALSVNYCASQDIQQCPSCRSYCQRHQPNQVQTNCAVCSRNMKLTYLFCWYCLRAWKNPRSEQICGNENCTKDKIEFLKKSPMIELPGEKKNITFPKLRACPHCFTTVSYENGCNEVTCKQCMYAFCIICLIPQRGGSLICKSGQSNNIVCVPAPIQTRLHIL